MSVGISGIGYGYYGYWNRNPSSSSVQGVSGTGTPSAIGNVSGPSRVSGTTIPAAQPGEQPGGPASERAFSAPLNKDDILRRLETDPVAMAVRGRIRYGGDETKQGIENGSILQGIGIEKNEKQPGDELHLIGDTKSAQEVMEEGECQTCARRKYQDGSDDPGVSFKSPTHISPEMAASAVHSHENEHVVREQAKAAREDRKVVSQSVTYHTAICPECGRVYVSGGTTRTVTTGKDEEEQFYRQPGEKEDEPGTTSTSTVSFFGEG